MRAVGLFALVVAIYVASPISIQTDSIWSIPTAASLLHEGNMELSEFRPTFTSYTHHGITELGDRAYYDYPMGAVLLAAPWLALFDLVAPSVAPEWHRRFHQVGDIDIGYFNRTERCIASLYVGAAVVLVFLTARRRAGVEAALGVAVLFALGTSAYSTSSRVLWQHAPSLCLSAAVVYLLSSAQLSARTATVLGLVVAAAYVCRPTHAVTVCVVCAWMALRRRARLVPFLLGALVIAIPFCAYNWRTYGMLRPPYYQQGLDFESQRFLIGLTANLVSPARGLLVFSPFLILALGNIAWRIRSRSLSGIEAVFAVIIGLHWLAVSAFPTWWAGHSYGARFMTDVLPDLAYFLVDPLQAMLVARRPAWLVPLALAAVFSIFIHTRASTRRAVWRWNDGPPDVNDAPSRVWDWRDAEFLR